MKYTVPRYEVKAARDVVYRTAEGYWTEGPDHGAPPAGDWAKPMGARRELALTMDIYQPEGDGPEDRPLLLMMHGGAYLIGSKNEKGQTEWCKHFASLGYVAASINYRLGFRLTNRGLLQAESDAAEDARWALAYLIGQEELRIDPGRVFVAGTSAGAATALALAYPGPAEGRAGDADAPALPCRIRAVGNLWGYVRDLSVLESARVPIVSFQSVQDPFVPYGEGWLMGPRRISGRAFGTRAVHDRAAALGIPCDHTPCPYKAHRLHLDTNGVLTPYFYSIRDRLNTFFAAHMTDTD